MNPAAVAPRMLLLRGLPHLPHLPHLLPTSHTSVIRTAAFSTPCFTLHHAQQQARPGASCCPCPCTRSTRSGRSCPAPHHPALSTRHCTSSTHRDHDVTTAAAGKAAGAPAHQEDAPLCLYGQVISGSVGFVRVQLLDRHPDPEQSQPPAASSSSSAGLPCRQLLCNVRSLLRKLRKNVLVGDHVQVVNVDWKLGRGSVQDVLPRSTELVDPAIANVDHALLVFAVDSPPFEELPASKFLVSMEASGLPFTLLLNKVDLVAEELLQRRVEQVRSWGYEPLVVSCETGRGLMQVKQVLSGRTSVVAGPSGAGKSSLINALRMGRHRPDQAPLHLQQQQQQQEQQQQHETQPGLDPEDLEPPQPPPGSSATPVHLGVREDGNVADVDPAPSIGEFQASGQVQGTEPALPPASAAPQGRGAAEPLFQQPEAPEPGAPGFLAVGEMSRVGRGMHTTSNVTLIPLQGGGMLADTPGFSQPSLSQISSQDLASLFPEIVALTSAEPCRFSNCVHLMEPGCSVNNENRAMERYPFYVKMLIDIKSREECDIKSLQQAKQQRDGSSKVKTGKGGKQRLEAKLDGKQRLGSRQQGRRDMMQALDD